MLPREERNRMDAGKCFEKRSFRIECGWPQHLGGDGEDQVATGDHRMVSSAGRKEATRWKIPPCSPCCWGSGRPGV